MKYFDLTARVRVTSLGDELVDVEEIAEEIGSVLSEYATQDIHWSGERFDIPKERGWYVIRLRVQPDPVEVDGGSPLFPAEGDDDGYPDSQ